MSFAVVVQGPATHIEAVSAALIDYDVIFSTWEGLQPGSKLEQLLAGPRHQVLVNPAPLWRGRGNLNLQKQSTLSGLIAARSAGHKFSLKIRSDMVISGIDELAARSQKMIERGPARIFFFDWVLHRSGYPMDFIQFASTEDLIGLWRKVRTFTLTYQASEELLKNAFRRQSRGNSSDPNVWKQMGFMASTLNSIPGADVIWLKKDISFCNDWKGNPVFVQCAGMEEISKVD
jgi:hypothetical protein